MVRSTRCFASVRDGLVEMSWRSLLADEHTATCARRSQTGRLHFKNHLGFSFFFFFLILLYLFPRWLDFICCINLLQPKRIYQPFSRVFISFSRLLWFDNMTRQMDCFALNHGICFTSVWERAWRKLVADWTNLLLHLKQTNHRPFSIAKDTYILWFIPDKHR